MYAALVVVLITLCVNLSECDYTHIGKCPQVQPMDGFDFDKFLGLWYTIAMSATNSPCRDYNYVENVQKPGQYQQIEINPKSTSLAFKYVTRDIALPDTNVPARMNIKLPRERHPSSLIVLATDYENYASVFTYKQDSVACKMSAKILSRTPSLDESYVTPLRSQLAEYNLTTPMDCSKPSTQVTQVTQVTDSTVATP